MNNQKRTRFSSQVKLDIPLYTPIGIKDITSYLHNKIFYKYKGINKIPRKNLNYIATFTVDQVNLTEYKIWIFMRSVTPDLLLKLYNEDFIYLFKLMKNQSTKFHSKELIMREYPPSKKHPYDKNPIPVYRRGTYGNMELIRGKEDYTP